MTGATQPRHGAGLSPRTVERYAEFLESRGDAVAVEGGTVFYRYNQIVEPLAPASHDAALSADRAAALLKRLGGALIRWGNGVRTRDTGWYAVVCDSPPVVEDNPSPSARREIRKGLRNCRAEPIDADYVARHGYDVYRSAFDRYRGRYTVDDPATFERRVRAAAPYPELMEWWGVFAGDKLAGYSANYVFEDVEVYLTETKFDPAYLKTYSSYALMQTMTSHYLDRGVGRVNAGARSLVHDTAFQEYLMSRFGFGKAHIDLSVRFKRPIGLALAATRPLRRVLSRVDPRLDALYELRDISG